MTLAIDVDGVLADFCGAVNELIYNSSTCHPLPGWESWALEDNIPACCSVHINAAMRSAGWCAAIPAIAGACEAVREAIDAGVSIILVTAPLDGSPYWMHERMQWVAAHIGSDVPVIFAGGAHKQYIRCVGAVEDNERNLRSMPAYFKYLIDRPYNRGATGGGLRVDHVRDAIRSYALVTRQVFPMASEQA